MTKLNYSHRALGSDIEKDYIPRLTQAQRYALNVLAHIPLKERIYLDWTGYIRFHAFKCEKHGYVCDYPHGFNQILSCPLCRNDKNEHK